MKLFGIFSTIIFFVISWSPESSGYEVNLYEPYKALMTRLDHQNLPPLDLELLFVGIFKLLGCLASNTTTQFAEAEFLQSIPEMKLSLPAVETMAEYFQIEDGDFRQIHKFLWDTGSEWNDAIAFLHKYGFKTVGEDTSRDIYVWFKNFYANYPAPDNLDPPLPEGPPALSKTSNMNFKKYPQVSDWPLNSLFQEQPGCTLAELAQILHEIFTSQGLQWFGFLRYVQLEINGNPASHVFWAKTTEPQKGVYFRNFTQLEAVVKIVHKLDTDLKQNGLFQLVIGILEGLTGINFDEININVVRNLISIAEFFIWRTPFPFPVFPVPDL